MGDDFFGGMFDFNGDGVTDIGEAWEAYNIYEECTHEDEEYTPHKRKAPVKTQAANTRKEPQEKGNNQETTSAFATIVASCILLTPALILATAAIGAGKDSDDIGLGVIIAFGIIGLTIIILKEAFKKTN